MLPQTIPSVDQGFLRPQESQTSDFETVIPNSTKLAIPTVAGMRVFGVIDQVNNVTECALQCFRDLRAEIKTLQRRIGCLNETINDIEQQFHDGNYRPPRTATVSQKAKPSVDGASFVKLWENLDHISQDVTICVKEIFDKIKVDIRNQRDWEETRKEETYSRYLLWTMMLLFDKLNTRFTDKVKNEYKRCKDKLEANKGMTLQIGNVLMEWWKSVNGWGQRVVIRDIEKNSMIGSLIEIGVSYGRDITSLSSQDGFTNDHQMLAMLWYVVRTSEQLEWNGREYIQNFNKFFTKHFKKDNQQCEHCENGEEFVGENDMKKIIEGIENTPTEGNEGKDRKKIISKIESIYREWAPMLRKYGLQYKIANTDLLVRITMLKLAKANLAMKYQQVASEIEEDITQLNSDGSNADGKKEMLLWVNLFTLSNTAMKKWLTDETKRREIYESLILYRIDTKDSDTISKRYCLAIEMVINRIYPDGGQNRMLHYETAIREMKTKLNDSYLQKGLLPEMEYKYAMEIIKNGLLEIVSKTLDSSDLTFVSVENVYQMIEFITGILRCKGTDKSDRADCPDTSLPKDVETEAIGIHEVLMDLFRITNMTPETLYRREKESFVDGATNTTPEMTSRKEKASPINARSEITDRENLTASLDVLCGMLYSHPKGDGFDVRDPKDIERFARARHWWDYMKDRSESSVESIPSEVAQLIENRERFILEQLKIVHHELVNEKVIIATDLRLKDAQKSSNGKFVKAQMNEITKGLVQHVRSLASGENTDKGMCKIERDSQTHPVVRKWLGAPDTVEVDKIISSWKPEIQKALGLDNDDSRVNLGPEDLALVKYIQDLKNIRKNTKESTQYNFRKRIIDILSKLGRLKSIMKHRGLPITP